MSMINFDSLPDFIDLAGFGINRAVYYNELYLDPTDSFNLATLSESYDWGFQGSGPIQLAMAILLKAGIPDHIVLDLAGYFVNDFVANLADGNFKVKIAVKAWVALRITPETKELKLKPSEIANWMTTETMVLEKIEVPEGFKILPSNKRES